MIIGQPGSGKSTLARELGVILALPVVHIDQIHYRSHWVERPGHEKDQLCAEVHARHEWIFEGGRSRSWPDRVERADLLIWLDVPFVVRAWRVFWRTCKYYGTQRPDLTEGCLERFSWDFTAFVWRTRRSGQQRMHRFFSAAGQEKVKFRLTNSHEVADFLESLRKVSVAI